MLVIDVFYIDIGFRKKLGKVAKLSKSSSSPSAPARTIKPVFREKLRNTGFSLTCMKQFKLHFCSRV